MAPPVTARILSNVSLVLVTVPWMEKKRARYAPGTPELTGSITAEFFVNELPDNATVLPLSLNIPALPKRREF